MTRKTMDLKRNMSIYYKLVHSDLVGALILDVLFLSHKEVLAFCPCIQSTFPMYAH